MFKDSLDAKKIIAAQDENGLWGNFHSLAEPTNKPYTTEQALRRLEILGYTKFDLPIKRTIDFMEACLRRNAIMPDRREESHNWDIFMELMLATWIRRFSNDSDCAKEIALKWAHIVSMGFKDGKLNPEEYNDAYQQIFGEKIYGGVFKDCANFYHVSLLKGMLEPQIEMNFIDYILNHPQGIYYLGYNKKLKELPDKFDSKQTVKFIASIKLLQEYDYGMSQLGYVERWLNKHKASASTWELSSNVKDKIYLPLSESWRKKERRINDCTYFINEIVSTK